ncbi:hypothetical protein N9Z12_01895 [Opitutaceae bacterium]|nr:hypothetical protein [Opitutaceae bacterium]
MIASWRRWVSALIGAGILSGLLLQGSLLHILLLMIPVVWVVGPLGIACGVAVLVARLRGKKNSRSMYRTIMALVAYLIFTGVSLSTGSSFHHLKEHQIFAYVEEALPLVDAFYAEKGHYPSTLQECGVPSSPFLVGKSLSYSGRDQDFSFIYIDNQSFMGGLLFNSGGREWIHWS